MARSAFGRLMCSPSRWGLNCEGVSRHHWLLKYPGRGDGHFVASSAIVAKIDLAGRPEPRPPGR